MQNQEEIIRRIAALPPEKRAVFEKMLRNEKEMPDFPKSDSSIRPVPRNKDIPLSFSQQRLMFLYRLDKDSTAYNITAGIRFAGPLNISALEQSFNAIIRRHESLRTAFPEKDDVFVQIIAPDLSIAMDIVELHQISELDKSAEVLVRTADEVRRPFDLEKSPLLRCSLLCLSREEYALLFSIHHIITDGWSMGIFVRELIAFYQAFSKGSHLFLPELPIQYADFACWQNECLKNGEWKTQLDYWKKQLAGAPPVLELPSDRVRPSEMSYRGGTENFDIAYDLTKQLKRLGHQSGATLFMTLFSAFVALLYRYTNQEDIVIGTPIANRNRSETESLIGFFANTLALRTDLSGNPSFSKLLERVRRVTLDAYSHQDMPFEKLVEVLQPERSLSRSPLFQVMFVLQNAPMEKLELPGLAVHLMEIETVSTQFDLSLSLTETESGLTGTVEYSSDLFDKDRIRRMTEHFKTLLEGVAVNSEQTVSELPLLSEHEWHQLLVEFNDTARDYPRDRTVVDLFEEQVEKTPGNIAVIFEDRKLTYRELNERANRIAHFLRDKYDIQPDDRIGLLAERSEWIVVGILGILKSGGAYVPMEPEYPEERIRHIITDSGCKLVLSSENQKVTGEKFGVEFVNIRDIGSDAPITPHPVPRTSHLAYVIYTSGSSGVPKGVLIEHGNLYDYVMTFMEEFGVSSDDIFLQQTTVTFDASVEEIYPALCIGATIVISRDPKELDTLFADAVRHSITILSLSPSAAGYFNTRADELHDLRAMTIGGDVLYPSHIDRLFAKKADFNKNGLHSGKMMLYNGYGPTESTVCAAYFKIDSLREFIPIGKPIANRRIYILDAALNPVPICVFGEICIAGAGTARGYLNRDELTKEKFIPNPFAAGERLYRTGDVGRWLPDGNIEFLGRNDSQVKIRGYRIELGEIENRLLSHEAVKEAAVIARGDESHKELAAYVVSDKTELNTGILREYLKQTLPDYMIPSHFVNLGRLPLMPNGKIDRKALPDPVRSVMDSGTEYIAPRNEIEIRLAKIWQDVLDIQKIGVKDNFFEIGGHSLKALTITARIRKEFGLDIPLSEIYQKSTIEDQAYSLILCKKLDDHQLQGRYGYFLDEQRKGKILFCFPPLLGTLMAFSQLAEHLDCCSLYSFDFIRNEDRIKCYMDSIQSVQTSGPYILIGYSAGGNLAFHVAGELAKRGETVSDLILFDSMCRKEKPHFDKEEVTEEVTSFLSRSEAVPFMEDDKMRQLILNYILAYERYFSSVADQGMFEGDIHLILSENSVPDMGSDWQEVASGTVRTYQGKGLHENMLTGENARVNSRMLKEILSEP